MKKLLLLFSFCLCVTLLLTLAACADTVETSTEPAVTTTEEPKLTIGNPSAIGYKTEGETKLPIIRINTESGDAITSRDEYIRAGVSVSGSLDDAIFGMTDAPADVRCRGNYTYISTEKKSYRLKFDQKVNLFGQGEGAAKSWVLLANHCDKSMLRNHVAFTVGKLLDNIAFTPSSSFVQLYVNGEYMGVYQVTEQHNVNKYRVNITEDPNVIDTDYLIERDYYVKDEGVEGKDYFVVGDKSYNIKTDYPDSELAEEKCEFLRKYFEAAYNAIKDGNKVKIANYIDLASCVDTYILQAFVKNIDVGWSSFFMVKKAGGKIYFTCPWDFDLACGNDERLDNGSAEGLYVGVKSYYSQEHEWFYLLMNQTWFCDMVRARWNEVKTSLIAKTRSELNRFINCFDGEMSKNFELWDIFTQTINHEPISLRAYRSFKTQTQYLRNWINKRYTYLDNLINSEAHYQQGGEIDDWWNDWWGW